MEELKKVIREIPDFPKKGILFYDVTTLFTDKQAFGVAIDALAHRYLNIRVDQILSVEARGFVVGAALAYRLGTGMILARKKGKLPWKTIGETYSLEYGTDRVEIHTDAVKKGGRVLVVDDLLATGGTAHAAATLVEKAGGKVVECAFIIELLDLKGRKKLKPFKTFSIIQY